MKAFKGKCIHMTNKIINIVLQRSLPNKKKQKNKTTTTKLENFAHSHFACQGDGCYPQLE